MSDVTACSCSPDGCDGEGYDSDDPRSCALCCGLDGELPCPADPATYDTTIESLMDTVCETGESAFDPCVVCADGSEPFASMNLGHGLVLDLTAKVRRTRP